ncbi:hypothetical protein CF335_g855 [Tilletia laevis]|nr:hypothetical protein CF335_g855 [Tilletia laevis]
MANLCQCTTSALAPSSPSPTPSSSPCSRQTRSSLWPLGTANAASSLYATSAPTARLRGGANEIPPASVGAGAAPAPPNPSTSPDNSHIASKRTSTTTSGTTSPRLTLLRRKLHPLPSLPSPGPPVSLPPLRNILPLRRRSQLRVPAPASSSPGFAEGTEQAFGDDSAPTSDRVAPTVRGPAVSFPCLAPPAHRAEQPATCSRSGYVGIVILSFAEGTEQVITDKIAHAPRDPKTRTTRTGLDHARRILRISRQKSVLDTALTVKHVFDVHEDDRFACMADVGWITGHSYISTAFS